VEIKESTGASAAQIEAAALEYITPQSMRKVVRRPKTEALDQHVMVPFKDGAISTRVGGEGKTVLLVHGWSANQTDMFYYVPPLVEQGFRVVALDLPAHGEATGLTAGLDQLAEGGTAIKSLDFVSDFDTLPALIVHSIDDPTIPVSVAEDLASYWKNSELLKVDGFKHRGLLKDEKLINRVVDFVT